MERNEDVEFIEPLEVSIDIDDRHVVVSPLRVGDIPTLLELVSPLFQQLKLFDEASIERFFEGRPNEQDVATLLSVLAVDADEIFGAISVLSGQPRDWLERLLPDRFARLVAICLEVNRDFFSHAVPPAAVAALVQLAKRSSTATPSSSSLPTGTGTTTSSATPSASSTPT